MSAVGTYHDFIGRFFTRFLLTARLFGRNQESASGKIRLSGLASHLCLGVQPPKNLCAVFSMSRTLGSASARCFLDAVRLISFVWLTRKLAFSEPELTPTLGASVMMIDQLPLTPKDRAAALQLENVLTDIFALIKLSHQMALNQIYEVTHSPYEKDTDEALFTSVSLLREKAALFEEKYFNEKLENGGAA